ncbi:short chain dehydrogenase [Dokdonia pacifica]|uniref:NAD(P)-dependent dehydrogenase, short-chain alcohol dehydrogenase family n=1 Tax=Dokdonia pacifica TaxID=1627892 RepID=A0A238VP03_9FLAO|nr:short chain dehydrogenase [Dokdonia pacifica]GGG19327.1 short chain dehydrogenase [Dokdonia pacifica]SNR36090.1 NAD(P)-dependent dehydrogenase, short-chain alcohol dehydrogenase family [Dokdonia pacifica]
MKILIIGGNGTIGKTVTQRFAENHEVIIAGRSSGDVTVDIASSASIQKMFEAVGKVDAIVNIAGDAKWDKFDSLSEDDFYIGIKSKMMGQVNLVRLGRAFLNDGGSVTLTTGILADEPVDMTTSAAMVNGAIQSFTKAVALELERGIRVNVVSADLVEDAYEKYKDYFPGNTPVPMQKVVDGYVKSVLGRINGSIIRIRA